MTTQTPAEAFDSPRDALRSLFNACVAMSQTNKEGAERLLAVHATLARAVEDAERYRYIRIAALEVSFNAQVSYSPGYAAHDADEMETHIDTARRLESGA